MGTVPTLPDIPVGYIVQPADMNNLAACAAFLLAKPFVRVEARSTGTALGNGTNTAMHWDTENADGDNMFNSGNPTRLTVQTPGWFKFRYCLVTTSTTLVNVAFLQATSGANNPNGAGVTFGPFWGSDATGSTGGSKGAGAGGLWPYYLYVGDYLEVYAQANGTGDALDTGPSSYSFF